MQLGPLQEPRLAIATCLRTAIKVVSWRFSSMNFRQYPRNMNKIVLSYVVRESSQTSDSRNKLRIYLRYLTRTWTYIPPMIPYCWEPCNRSSSQPWLFCRLSSILHSLWKNWDIAVLRVSFLGPCFMPAKKKMELFPIQFFRLTPQDGKRPLR